MRVEKMLHASRAIGWLASAVISVRCREKANVYVLPIRCTMLFDQYSEYFLRMVTTQYQIICGHQGPWDRKCLQSFRRLWFPTSQEFTYFCWWHSRQPMLDLDQLTLISAAAKVMVIHVCRWLPLRLKTCERQIRVDSNNFQALRHVSDSRWYS